DRGDVDRGRHGRAHRGGEARHDRVAPARNAARTRPAHRLNRDITAPVDRAAVAARCRGGGGADTGAGRARGARGRPSDEGGSAERDAHLHRGAGDRGGAGDRAAHRDERARARPARGRNGDDLTMATIEVSTDRSRIDVDRVHTFLCNESYWAKGIPRETV